MDNTSRVFLAHSKNRSGQTDPVRAHVKAVADRAATYGEAFGISEEARLSGLLHDLGKYGELFQRRLQGKESGIDHWSAGAWFALTRYQKNGIAAALTIQGHHVGLNQATGDSLRRLNLKELQTQHPLGLRLSEPNLEVLSKRMASDGVNLPNTNDTAASLYSGLDGKCAAAMLDIRMLFSTLVDADFIETEAFFAPDARGNPVYRESGPPLAPEKALTYLVAYLKTLASQSTASPAVNKIRQDLLKSCLDAASLPQGLFTLTAPTGTGKTLSMLAFALKHAEQHHLRRIILVLPYLNIIDQSVKEYYKVFSTYLSPEDISRYILEHHSLAGIHERQEKTNNKNDVDAEDEVQSRRQALTENWDSPIIITTSVQFLESLFGNRPGSSRKLHRLAKSVILFDEVQTLPNNLAIPTLATLSRLTERYGSTIVFATATQPAFGHLDKSVKEYCTCGWQPGEIVPETLNLFGRAKRVDVEWDTDKPLSWTNLAQELNDDKQALCVVNLKRHAAVLYDELKGKNEGSIFHLSTNMCPAHRQLVLDEVRRRLIANEPCRLVSTQCIEAGVDVDFPSVYRAFGPLDSIAQAAGRCNRNGHNAVGIVHVFKPEIEENRRPYPDGAYAQAADVTSMLLKRYGKNGMDISNPSLFTEYYRMLYQITGIESIKSDLINAINNQNFSCVAELYRIIDQDTINVLVPYEKEIEAFETLKKEAQNTGLNRDWIRKARPLTISLFRPKAIDPVISYLEPVMIHQRNKPFETESDDWFIYLEKTHYHPDKGLILPGKSRVMIA